MTIYYFYISSLLFIGLINVGTKGSTKLLCYTSSFVILVFIGFRYELGVDWLLYRDFFNGGTITLVLEPGYQIVSLLLSLTGMSFWIFICCITLFSLVVLNCFFKKISPYPVFALAFYYCLSLLFNVDAIRQVMAVSFFYMGFQYLINKKNNHYYVCVLIASTCHISAVLMLILPLMTRERNIRLQKLLLVPGFFLAVLGFYPIEVLIQTVSLLVHNSYTEKLLTYTTPENISPVLKFSLFFKMIIVALYFSRKKYLIKNKLYEESFIYIERIIVFMFFLDVYIGRFGTITSRLDEYFIPSFVCLATLVIYSFSQILNRIMLTLFIILYLLVSFYRLSQDDYFRNQFIPYQNYLWISLDSSRLFDKSREQAVDYHWKTREK